MEAKPEAFLMLKALPSFSGGISQKTKIPVGETGIFVFRPQAASGDA